MFPIGLIFPSHPSAEHKDIAPLYTVTQSNISYNKVSLASVSVWSNQSLENEETGTVDYICWKITNILIRLLIQSDRQKKKKSNTKFVKKG